MNNRERLVIAIAVLASGVSFLDSSVVNVALPAIVRDLGGGLAAQQWIVDAYLLTLGSLILIAGSLSDLFGRQKVLAAGLIGFLIASVACALAPSSLFLILARSVQGIAGALLVPSSLALIIAAFKGEAQGKAIGMWTAWTGIAFVIGPLLGGFLIDAATWRWVFWINVLPIAVTLYLLRRLKFKETLPRETHVDVLGTLLCGIGLGGPVFAFIMQPTRGWDSPLVIFPLLVGLVSFASFLVYERRTKYPMLPLELFSVQNFRNGNLATIAIYGGLSIATFLIVLFLQQAGRYTALAAGLALLPITVIMFFLSPRFGALSHKYGPRLFMTVGPLIAGLGFLLLLRVDGRVDYWTQVLPGIIVFGIGLSITVAPLTAAILADIKPSHAGMGSAVNNAVARIAGLIAIALIGLIIGDHAFDSGSMSHSLFAFHRGVIAMVVLLCAGGLISALGIRNPDRQPAKSNIVA